MSPSSFSSVRPSTTDAPGSTVTVAAADSDCCWSGHESLTVDERGRAKTRKSHEEQERKGLKWKPGMRTERHEVKQDRKRKRFRKKEKRQSTRHLEEQKGEEHKKPSVKDQSATFSDPTTTFSDISNNICSDLTQSSSDEDDDAHVLEVFGTHHFVQGLELLPCTMNCYLAGGLELEI